MFKAAYGAGFRAGTAEPKLIRVKGFLYTDEPVCPYPPRRFLSRAAWIIGQHDGQMKRLSKPLSKKAQQA